MWQSLSSNRSYKAASSSGFFSSEPVYAYATWRGSATNELHDLYSPKSAANECPTISPEISSELYDEYESEPINAEARANAIPEPDSKVLQTAETGVLPGKGKKTLQEGARQR